MLATGPNAGGGGPAAARVTDAGVVRWRQATTGSWFAHARNDRLWLDRLEIRRDDGELVTLNLDHYSVIQVLN